ncbi:hypothetical protein IGI04_039144 [Brassica rapa subsp. trilocularis]|uniref:NAD-dependent epimerase/dehydratase domain-containing protein n=1 Tax=Brassica rapa subsp. trilocularis TaxID=1813537 RepID=A0ABQ7KNI7_BRACM|nr:hypothetical protein IGI04_039144 [Brassica rapa subsp. trilocularis]
MEDNPSTPGKINHRSSRRQWQSSRVLVSGISGPCLHLLLPFAAPLGAVPSGRNVSDPPTVISLPGAERSVRGGRRHQLDVLPLLKKLVELVPFTHVMHLAAQAGVRYAMDNPSSYVHSNKPKRLLTLTTTSTASPSPPSGFLPSTVLGEDLTWLISSSPETSSEANLFPSSKAEKNTGSGGKKRGPAQLRVSSV